MPRPEALPVRISLGTLATNVSTGTAKFMPLLRSKLLVTKLLVVIPTMRPALSTNGPPEFPRVTHASVWMAPSIRVPAHHVQSDLKRTVQEGMHCTSAFSRVQISQTLVLSKVTGVSAQAPVHLRPEHCSNWQIERFMMHDQSAIPCACCL